MYGFLAFILCLRYGKILIVIFARYLCFFVDITTFGDEFEAVMASKGPKLNVLPFYSHGDRLDLGKRWENGSSGSKET